MCRKNIENKISLIPTDMCTCMFLTANYSILKNKLCSYHNLLTSSSTTIIFKKGKHLRKFRSPQTPAKTQAVRLCHVKGSSCLMGPERDPQKFLCVSNGTVHVHCYSQSQVLVRNETF